MSESSDIILPARGERDWDGKLNAAMRLLHERQGTAPLLRHVNLTADTQVSADYSWPTDRPVRFQVKQEGGEHSLTWDPNIDGSVATPVNGEEISFSLIPQPSGRWRVVPDAPRFDVRAYGARGDGVADDSEAFNKAIAAAPDGGIISAGRGSFRWAQQVKVTEKSLHLDFTGATIINDCASTPLVVAGSWGEVLTVNSVSETTVTLADISLPVTVVELSSPPGYRRGDVVKVYSDDVLPGSREDVLSPPANASRTGQFYSVQSCVGTTVTLMGRVRDPLTTNIRISRLSEKRFSVEGGVFVSSESAIENYVSHMIEVSALAGPEIKNCVVKQCTNQSIRMISCYGYVVSNVDVRWSQNNPARNQFGYGVSDNQCEYGKVLACNFTQARHAYSTLSRATAVGSPSPSHYGRTYGARVVGCTTVGALENGGFDTHLDAEDVLFLGCLAVDCNVGYNLRGRRVMISDCQAIRCGTALFVGDEGRGDSWGHVVDGFQIVDADRAIRAVVRQTGHRSAGTRETRAVSINNVRATGISGVEPIANAGHTLSIRNSYFEAISPHDDFVRLTSGAAKLDGVELVSRAAGASVFHAAGSACEISAKRTAVEGVGGYSLLANNEGASAHAWDLDIQVDAAPAAVVNTRPITGALDWQAPSASSRVYQLSEATTTASLRVIGQTRGDILLNLSPPSAGTLGALPPGLRYGQRLRINNLSGNAMTIVDHAGTYRTSLGGNKVLTASGIDLFWNGSAWQYVPAL